MVEYEHDLRAQKAYEADPMLYSLHPKLFLEPDNVKKDQLKAK